MIAKDEVVIVFDGDCVFCANFARLMRLRETFPAVRLIDARDADDPIIADLKQRYRLNDGFVAIAEGREYYGPDAIQFLALASSEQGWISRLPRLGFRAPGFARFGYPPLVRLRKLGLRLMGRSELAY